MKNVLITIGLNKNRYDISKVRVYYRFLSKLLSIQTSFHANKYFIINIKKYTFYLVQE